MNYSRSVTCLIGHAGNGKEFRFLAQVHATDISCDLIIIMCSHAPCNKHLQIECYIASVCSTGVRQCPYVRHAHCDVKEEERLGVRVSVGVPHS